MSNAHSNPKIINPKKKSRYGQTLSPYDSDEEAELDDESDDDDDDWLLNVSSLHLSFVPENSSLHDIKDLAFELKCCQIFVILAKDSSFELT